MGHDDHDHDHDHDHAHDHDHHDHAHDHDHHHDHAHHHAAERRADLARGAGVGKIRFLDAPSGLAGAVIIAALAVLGVPETVIAEAAAALPIAGFHLHFGSSVKSGIVASSFDVHVESAQPERTYATVKTILEASSLAPEVKALAHATFERLARS